MEKGREGEGVREERGRERGRKKVRRDEGREGEGDREEGEIEERI